MARILLGVSGGIAAYKALEFVRLATGAGHAVRVVQTPASRRFVGEASFAALSGAPVLVSEFERDPARGAFPGDELPTHEPLSHLELVGNAELYLIENVPFGTVTVQVPRNARDPEAHALARARALIGVDEPEHIEVRDWYEREKPSETLKDDLYVELHFNGFYEA